MRGPGAAPARRRRPLKDTLPALFAAGRPADPDALLLETPAGARLTYGDADRRTAGLAHTLRAAGVGRGDRVVLQAEKSVEALLLYLATLRVGAALVPLNPAYTAEEVAYFVDDAEPALVLDDAGLAGLSTSGGAETFDDVAVGPDDLAAVVYTSGTTGRPKGALLRHRALASNADVLHRAWGFTADDVLLHALPIFHVHGLFVAVHCVLASGASMAFLPRFDVDAVLEGLPASTVMMGVPTHYTRLLDDPRLDRDRCRGMRLFVSGSAPLLAATHERFHQRTGHVILERYGMTETSMIASNPLDGERRPGTVGLPLPGVDVRIAEDGVIEVRGPNVLDGYWGRPDLAATEFTADGWFRTGDLGGFDADGYLQIVGRAKDLIISGGLNVHPVEVEDVVDRCESVLESAVIGLPDPDFGEVVVAVVVPATGCHVDEDAVRTAARERLAPFKVPKRVLVVEALPRNAMGKVEKAALRRRFS